MNDFVLNQLNHLDHEEVDNILGNNDCFIVIVIIMVGTIDSLLIVAGTDELRIPINFKVHGISITTVNRKVISDQNMRNAEDYFVNSSVVAHCLVQVILISLDLTKVIYFVVKLNDCIVNG